MTSHTAKQITLALGGRWEGGYGMGRCPVHKDRTPSLKILESRDGEPIFHCFAGCAWQDIKAALRREGIIGEHRDTCRRYGAPRRAAPSPSDSTEQARTEAAQELWKKAVPASGTPVETYLRFRGITIPVPPSIRFLPNAWHGPTGLCLPAMIAAVQVLEGGVVGIHRTFLHADGQGKAPITRAKMMLGKCAGGAVRLALAGPKLVIGEGIETSLSVQQETGLPAWAALSASGMKKVAVPEGVSEVIIAADGDEPGEKAACETAKRFILAGRSARIMRAPAGRDFNDVIRGRAQ